MSMSEEYASVELVEQRLSQYEREVSEEPWKKDHDRAMQCLSFESTLRLGIALFDFIVGIDEVIRAKVYKAHAAGTPVEKERAAIEHSMKFLKWWLGPCAQVEHDLKGFEDSGYTVACADQFRKNHENAKWMVADAKDVFADEKFVTLRDEAVEDLRSRDD